MRIGLLFGSFAGGGAERMMINLAKGLSYYDITPVIYVVKKKGPFLKEVPSNIKIVSYNGSFGTKSIIHKVRNTLKNDGLDALISTQMYINASVAIASLGLNELPKLIFREANTPSVIRNLGFKKRIYKFFYRYADHYVGVSEGVRDDLVELFSLNKDDTSVVYNPVVDESIKKLMYEEVEHRWFNNDDCPIITGMGTITPRKGFEDLIKAFYLLREKRRARLVIFGDRHNEKYYNKLLDLVDELDLNEFVRFPGFVNNPFKYLYNSSLFVLSSRYEGLPGVLIQAMACGCPVVSTDCPSGPREILDEGKFGELVDVNCPTKLAEAMNNTLNNPQNKEKLMNRADFFSVNNAAKQYLDIVKGNR